MTPERWQQVKGVLENALETAPQGRAAFLEQACGGDQALRREVESLVDVAIKPKSPSEQAIYSSADSYTGLGDAKLKLAAKETHPAPQLAHWTKACALYQVSLKTWSTIPEPGVESPEGYECIPPAAVAVRLKRCQAAVAKENSNQGAMRFRTRK